MQPSKGNRGFVVRDSDDPGLFAKRLINAAKTVLRDESEQAGGGTRSSHRSSVHVVTTGG